jgi:hypothetical protein
VKTKGVWLIGTGLLGLAALAITLSGHAELEVAGGKKIELGPGSNDLVEDTTAQSGSRTERENLAADAKANPPGDQFTYTRGGGNPTIPAYATAWGYTNMSFLDNFNSTSTIDLFKTDTGGYNWYLDIYKAFSPAGANNSCGVCPCPIWSDSTN